MRPEPGVFASFSDPSAAARAALALRRSGCRDVRAAMPAPFPELEQALARPRSRLGWFTFAGAVLGLLAGVALTAGTSLALPLVTGGKPILSLPPFAIVIFEVTVLFGTLVNLLALVAGAWRGGRRRPFPRLPAQDRFSRDRIGLFAVGGDPMTAERILRESGAEEVSHVG